MNYSSNLFFYKIISPRKTSNGFGEIIRQGIRKHWKQTQKLNSQKGNQISTGEQRNRRSDSFRPYCCFGLAKIISHTSEIIKM